MNRSRIIILALAALAAGAAALLARGFLGGGTEPGKAGPVANLSTVGVLVAASAIEPGRAITPEMVRWQDWPKATVDSTFITQESGSSPDQVVKGTVARAPILSGEPLTNTKIVHSEAAGFMAATVSQGMRAVSIPITVESGAGGFILPNDRVDLIVSTLVSDSPRTFAARTLLHDVRVLAVDQTVTQDKDQKAVLAKTATLELTPSQAEIVGGAAASGPVSLALRPLGDNGEKALAKNTHGNDSQVVSIIRYGLGHANGGVAAGAR